MARIRTSLALTKEEVEVEEQAWKHGCTCHTCRIINGTPEPFHGNIQINWLES